MPKDQASATKPDQPKERLHASDVPSIGTPAPPIDPDAVPGLMMEKPKLKRKNRATIGPLIIIALIVALVVLGVASTVIVQRRSTSAIVVMGDGRIEPPEMLPASTTQFGPTSTVWKQGFLDALAWDTWTYLAFPGDTLTVYVNPISDGFVPILGLYNPSGTLIAKSQDDRTQPQKSVTYTFEMQGQFTILVSNIGGAEGSYEIRSQTGR